MVNAYARQEFGPEGFVTLSLSQIDAPTLILAVEMTREEAKMLGARLTLLSERDSGAKAERGE